MAEELATQFGFDYDDLLEDDRGYVRDRAEHIRDSAKRTAQGVISIGQWLVEVKARLGHGRWEPWLGSEFGWSDRTARRFMQVYELVKTDTVADLVIDLSALYLIASPSTPEPVVQEILERAKAGEPMTKAKAAAVLNEHRKLASGSTQPKAAPAAAPVPEAREKAEAKEQSFVWGIYLAVETVAKARITPLQMATLGHREDCEHLAEWAEQAGSWLLDVAREAREHEAAVVMAVKKPPTPVRPGTEPGQGIGG